MIMAHPEFYLYGLVAIIIALVAWIEMKWYV